MTKRELIDLLRAVPDEAEITLINDEKDHIPIELILLLEDREPPVVELHHEALAHPDEYDPRGRAEHLHDQVQILEGFDATVLYPLELTEAFAVERVIEMMKQPQPHDE